MFESLGRGQVDFLQDIVGINSAQQSVVEAKVDDPPKSISVQREQFGKCLRVSSLDALQ